MEGVGAEESERNWGVRTSNFIEISPNSYVLY